MDDHHHFGCIKNSFQNNIESNPTQHNTGSDDAITTILTSQALGELWFSYEA
jgi:hypothetical protein